MIQEQLEALAAARGYQWIGNTMVGSCLSYPFYTICKEKYGHTLTSSFTLARGVRGKAVRGVRKELPKGCSLTARKSQLILVCSGKDDVVERFTASMEATAVMLKAEGATLPSVCPLCRNKNVPCDALALAGGYVPVHRECCQSHVYSSVTQAEQNTLNGSYLTGILGALLVGLLATIPVVLTTWLMNRMFALLYALIPLGAYQGYLWCRGKRNKVAVVIIILVSFLELFAIEQINFYIAIVQNFGVFPSVLETIPAYFRLMTTGEIISDMAMSVVFLILGLWISLRRITRTNQSQVQDAGVLLKSMTPLQSTWQCREP